MKVAAHTRTDGWTGRQTERRTLVGPQPYASASHVSRPTSLMRIKPRNNLIVAIRFGLADVRDGSGLNVGNELCSVEQWKQKFLFSTEGTVMLSFQLSVFSSVFSSALNTMLHFEALIICNLTGKTKWVCNMFWRICNTKISLHSKDGENSTASCLSLLWSCTAAKLVLTQWHPWGSIGVSGKAFKVGYKQGLN